MLLILFLPLHFIFVKFLCLRYEVCFRYIYRMQSQMTRLRHICIGWLRNNILYTITDIFAIHFHITFHISSCSDSLVIVTKSSFFLTCALCCHILFQGPEVVILLVSLLLLQFTFPSYCSYLLQEITLNLLAYVLARFHED